MVFVMLFVGCIVDCLGCKFVVIVGVVIFVIVFLFCVQVYISSYFFIGCFIQGIGVGSCYVVVFVILCDMLDDCCCVKVLLLFNGIICIIFVLVLVFGYLIMLKYLWQSLFYMMIGMGVMVVVLLVFILCEMWLMVFLQVVLLQYDVGELLLNCFFFSCLFIIIFSVMVILIYVNVLLVLMMEEMGFDWGIYLMVMVLMVMISMVVFFLMLFVLLLFNFCILMLILQVLFLVVGVMLSFVICQVVILIGLGMICVGFFVGFGVVMSQVLGLFMLCVGVVSLVFGIVQVCGLLLWIWFVVIIGFSVMNMLIGIFIVCSIVSFVLLLVVILLWVV